ncbi:uncharacterized protein JCM10292_000121 [Rhodotorula paludigena]|uniref:uncharacterized protein n=1 Tax=Rhodotorula paludigena TaxID=86838 RepID=UPI00316BDB60
MLPTPPVLSPTLDVSDVSPLSLPGSPGSPSSPSPSEFSLAAVDLTSSDDDTSSVNTADSCMSECCLPPVDDKPASFPPKVGANAAPSSTVLIDESAYSPLLIIGAGPHALALAARLSEPRPAALYSDLEHARLSWLKREQASTVTGVDAAGTTASGRRQKERRQAVKGHWGARKLVEPEQVTLAGAPAAGEPETSTPRAIQVLDSSGSEWMTRWNGFFSGLRIQHLRSPMLFHPAPADADALVAYARRMGREDELMPVKNVVGAERSKYQRKKTPSRVGRAAMINERDRDDYFRPSTPLFHSFIHSELIDRYHVAPLVSHATVTSVSYGALHVRGRKPSQGFIVESVRPDGTREVRGAKAVAMAIGPSTRPNVPAVIRKALPPMPELLGVGRQAPWNREAICGEGWCHSSAFALPGCRPVDGLLGEKLRRGEPTRAVVIGGGLTSAQIVDSLIASGVTTVTLLSRSHLKVKHFDFDLPWVAKYANVEKMAFYREDDLSERFDMIRRARNGGSMNPQFYHLTQKHAKSGRLDLRTLTHVEHAAWDGERKKWRFEVVTTPDRKKVKGDVDLGAAEPVHAVLEDVDFLVCSTGSELDLAKVDFVRPLMQSHPVELVHGLPALTQDLQWRKDVPFFVMGAYSMLELGPDALNLSGTRIGAERVAHRLGTLGIFDEMDGGGLQPGPGAKGRARRMAEKEHRSGGEGNFFDGLAEVEA